MLFSNVTKSNHVSARNKVDLPFSSCFGALIFRVFDERDWI